MTNTANPDTERERVLTVSLEAMAVIDGDEHVSVNQQYADLFGFSSPEDLVGEDWASRFAEPDRATIEREILTTCCEDGQWRGRVSGCTADGTTVPLELSVASVADGQFICSARSAPPPASSHSGVESQTQLLEHVFDAVDDIVYVLDEAGEIVLWNDTFRETVGYPDAEIETLNSGDVFTSSEADGATVELSEAPHNVDDQRVTLDVVTSDGERIPHELETTTFNDPQTGDSYYCGIARDITEQNAREAELRRQRTLVKGLLNAIPDVVFAYDNEGNHIVEEALLDEFAGYPKEETRKMELLDFMSESDRPTARENVQRALEEGETVTFEADIVTKDGRSIPHEYRAEPMELDGDVLGVAASARDITQRKERERDLRAARRFNEELVENAPFGIFRLDEQLRITYENPRAEEIVGLPNDQDESDAIGMDIREVPSIVEAGKADLFTRLQEGETIGFEFSFESLYDQEVYFTGRGVPLYRDDEFDGAILMLMDISDRRRNEKELERQRDELEILNRINDLILEITRELFESATREQIEQTVCDRFASSNLYQSAWIGHHDTESDRIVPSASAGIQADHLDTFTTTTEAESGRGPAARAIQSGELQVSQDVRTDPRFESWREQVLAHDIRSVVVVPVIHGDTIYGVLSVYATRPLAFSNREQAGFETLGKSVGFAINAIQNRKLLFSDTVVELEFEISDPNLVFVRVSNALDCDLTISGNLETKTGSWSVYLTVEGASPSEVRDFAEQDSGVDLVRIIADDDDSGVVEFVMDGTALNGLMESGAILTSGSVSGGQGRFCVESSQNTDVRQLVDRLRGEYPDSTLVAQREYDRPVQKAGEVRESIRDRLTDRQLEALLRAYHAGYFAWPRQNTASEVATSMGIADTTFHYHLRNGLETIASVLTEL